MPQLADYRHRTAWLLIGASLLAVALYNLWAYCCGRCRLENFLALGPFGRLLLALNLAAGLLLLILRLRRRRKAPRACRCGRVPAADWRFCGECGLALHPPQR